MDELKRPVPFEQWEEFLTPQEIVEVTAGLIGRPTAYKIVEEKGFVLGRRNMGISKITLLKWLLGDGNEYVLRLKAEESKWTREI